MLASETRMLVNFKLRSIDAAEQSVMGPFGEAVRKVIWNLNKFKYRQSHHN